MDPQILGRQLFNVSFQMLDRIFQVFTTCIISQFIAQGPVYVNIYILNIQVKKQHLNLTAQTTSPNITRSLSPQYNAQIYIKYTPTIQMGHIQNDKHS